MISVRCVVTLQKPLKVEIGKPPLSLRMLVSLATVDAHDVALKLERLWKAKAPDYSRHEDVVWTSLVRFDETSARVLSEIMFAIESGKHKVFEPELHHLRQTLTLMRRITVGGLHEREGGPISRTRLNLLRSSAPQLTDLSLAATRASETLPEDLVIEGVVTMKPHDLASSEASGMTRLIRDLRKEFETVHLSKVEVRIRLIQHSDDPAGKEHAEQAFPKFNDWIGTLWAGRLSADQIARTVILWTRDSEPTSFNETAHALRDIAKRGGAIVRSFNVLTEGWAFHSDEECWWALLFEMAWKEMHPTLRSLKHAWLDASHLGLGTIEVPYDIERLKRMKSRSDWAKLIPSEWLVKLPSAFVSDFDHVAWASMVLCDLLEEHVVVAKAKSSNGVIKEQKPAKKPLRKAFRNAYASYERAMNHFEREITDEEAYKWLKEEDPDTDYKLPRSFDTWQRYVRKGREARGTQKYEIQKSVVTSKSIVRSEDI
jgi:hypothetical protein